MTASENCDSEEGFQNCSQATCKSSSKGCGQLICISPMVVTEDTVGMFMNIF